MTFFALIAAAFTFSATATGVEKGTAVEFFFAGSDSDRDYETLFLLDEPVGDFCKRLEAAGIPRGKPEDVVFCRLWPVGCRVDVKPGLDEFVETKLPEGVDPYPFVYTGGARDAKGACIASTNMPLAAWSLYSLAQSPIVYSGHYEQSAVYNSHLVKKTMKKGTRVEFMLSWDESSLPKPLSLVIRPGNAADVIKQLQRQSVERELDVRIDFDPLLTVAEAVQAAKALSVVDSPRVKINGRLDGQLFYRAFLPQTKWRDRQERLVQPFELTVGPTNRLVYVESDWSVAGLDPKLTPKEISFHEAKGYPQTDTCFVFTHPETRLSTVYAAMKSLRNSSVRTWYLFSEE